MTGCTDSLVAALLCATSMAAAAESGAAATPDHASIDRELLLDLAGWAARLSGRAQADGDMLPTLLPLSDEHLAATVCPDQGNACRGLVAAYDTKRRRIIYRASLDMRDPTDQSFIVHELVHWLQHNGDADAVEASCAAVLDAEREAYAAQNRYLDHFRQWRRAGEVLRFTFCPANADSHAEPVVRLDAASGALAAGPGVR